MSRLVSAFNFQHPDGEQPLDSSNRKIYKCFSNISALAKHVLDDSECGRVARLDNNTHMGLGYCSYVGGHEVRNALLKHKNVLVIQQEDCEASSILALKEVKEFEHSGDNQHIIMPHVYVEKTKSQLPTSLAPAEMRNLHSWLRLSGEAQLYKDILKQFL
jgi:hypothetical protein